MFQLQSWGFPPLVSRVRLQAEELLRARGDCEPLGIHWIQKFLSRHDDLRSTFATPRDQERVNAITYSTVSDWFRLVEEMISVHKINQGDVYNMDEKGFTMGQINKQKVIAAKGTLPAIMSQSSTREWVSIIECISADGFLLPAFIIFKAKVMKKSWMDELEQGNIIALSDKGWTNNTLGMEWFRRMFNPVTKQRQQGEYRLLILDGHASHITNEVIRFCLEVKIILLCLPPHTTHVLQPLDVGFFLPLGSLYSTELLRVMSGDRSVNVDKHDFIKVYQKARRQTGTASTIASAWARAFLFPFEPRELLKTLLKEDNNLQMRPFTPPEVTFRSSDGTSHTYVIKTPGNVAEFDNLVHKARDGPREVLPFLKLNRAFEKLYVNHLNTEAINLELRKAQQQKNDKTKRSKEQLGKGLVMSHEILNKRLQKAQQLQDDKAAESKRKDIEIRRQKAAKKAKRKEDWLEKTFLHSIEYIASLFGDKKALSPKKRSVQQLVETPLLANQTVDFDAFVLAPPMAPSPSKSPERLIGRKPVHQRQKPQPRAQIAATKEQDVEEALPPPQFLRIGRQIRAPKRPD